MIMRKGADPAIFWSGSYDILDGRADFYLLCNGKEAHDALLDIIKISGLQLDIVTKNQRDCAHVFLKAQNYEESRKLSSIIATDAKKRVRLLPFANETVPFQNGLYIAKLEFDTSYPAEEVQVSTRCSCTIL